MVSSYCQADAIGMFRSFAAGGSAERILCIMKSFFRKLLGLSAAAVVSAAGLLPAAAPVYAGWVQSGSVWSYTESGKSLTGWAKIGGVWYYFDSNGRMLTGWQKIGSSWYYMNASGAMQTGWKRINGNWYFFNGGGVMKTGWLKNGGNWYFLNGGGVMKTGWVKTGGKWYYFQGSGVMQTGWLTVDGTQYYLDGNGVMLTGDQTIGGVSYRFSSSGALESSGGSDVSASDRASEVLSQINTARRKEGLSSLTLSEKLCEAALDRASEQAQMGKISHQRPDGTEWYTILVEYGLPATGCGENLAVNYTSASAVVKAWLESPAHKANIVNTQYRFMGVGYYEKNGNVYWVQLFSTAQ